MKGCGGHEATWVEMSRTRPAFRDGQLTGGQSLGEAEFGREHP